MLPKVSVSRGENPLNRHSKGKQQKTKSCALMSKSQTPLKAGTPRRYRSAFGRRRLWAFLVVVRWRRSMLAAAVGRVRHLTTPCRLLEGHDDPFGPHHISRKLGEAAIATNTAGLIAVVFIGEAKLWLQRHLMLKHSIVKDIPVVRGIRRIKLLAVDNNGGRANEGSVRFRWRSMRRANGRNIDRGRRTVSGVDMSGNGHWMVTSATRR